MDREKDTVLTDGAGERAPARPAALAGAGYVRTDASLFVCDDAPKGPPRTIEISKRAVLISVVIVLVLVIAAIVLTQVLPRGEYERVPDESGNMQIVPGTYAEDDSLPSLKWWQAVFAPFLVLDPTMDGSLMVWALIALLLVIGAVFTALDHTGVLIYMVEALRNKFRTRRYALLFILPLAFMFLGSSAGMFEELIPLVPVVVLLCYAFGWDALVGLAISVLAACFGFTAGVVNPFTVGVSQNLMGIPMFSGIEMRLLTFVVAYGILMAFVYPYARKIEKKPQRSLVYLEDTRKKHGFDFSSAEFVRDEGKSRALKWFACWMLVVVFFAVLSIFIQPHYIPALGDFSLADYVLYITVAIYVVAGIGACVMCGLRGKELFKKLGKGLVTLLPAVAMILIASGVRYIMEKGYVMDTILYKVTSACAGQSPAVIILLVYLAIFIFEMFIPSGSAKAFLLMPMIGAMCTQLGIDGQVAVLAFAYGDGFANVLLPTNAGLLLILGMTTVNYPKWIRWSGKIQFTLLAATVGILMLAQYVIYA